MNDKMKRFTVFMILIFEFTISYAQEPIKENIDSLDIYIELFTRITQEEFNDKSLEKALLYGNKIKDILDRELLEKDSAYCNFVFVLSDLYDAQGQKDKSSSLLTELLPTVQAIFGEKSTEYTTVLDYL